MCGRLCRLDDDEGVSDTNLNLVVIRTARLDAVRRFYEAIGLSFVDERHGAGPDHFAAVTPAGTVFELYPATTDQAVERGGVSDVRLGFTVGDLAVAVEAAERAGGTTIRPVSVPSGAAHAVIADPDGRRVDLIQRHN